MAGGTSGTTNVTTAVTRYAAMRVFFKHCSSFTRRFVWCVKGWGTRRLGTSPLSSITRYINSGMQCRVLVIKRGCKLRKIDEAFHPLFGIYPDLHGTGDFLVDHRDSENRLECIPNFRAGVDDFQTHLSYLVEKVLGRGCLGRRRVSMRDCRVDFFLDLRWNSGRRWNYIILDIFLYFPLCRVGCPAKYIVLHRSHCVRNAAPPSLDILSGRSLPRFVGRTCCTKSVELWS